MDEAEIIVGGLLLERVPKALIQADEVLEQYFEPALQEFTDFCRLEWKTSFEPPATFRQMVLDQVRTYLDMKRMRFGL